MGLEKTINILLAAGASTLVQDVFRQIPGEPAARYGHKSIAGRLGYPTREPKGTTCNMSCQEPFSQ
jgi:hypothetical protein